MNRIEAINFGNQKLKEYNLYQSGWRMVIDSRPKRRFGICRYGKKEIAVSAWCLNGGVVEGKVENTIIHEICHCLAGYEAGHGPKWRQWCIRLGIKPERCGSNEDVVVAPKAKFTVKCCSCKKTVASRHRSCKLTKYPERFTAHCCKSKLFVERN